MPFVAIAQSHAPNTALLFVRPTPPCLPLASPTPFPAPPRRPPDPPRLRRRRPRACASNNNTNNSSSSDDPLPPDHNGPAPQPPALPPPAPAASSLPFFATAVVAVASSASSYFLMRRRGSSNKSGATGASSSAAARKPSSKSSPSASSAAAASSRSAPAPPASFFSSLLQRLAQALRNVAAPLVALLPVTPFFVVLLHILSATVFLAFTESWPFLDALYFSVVTATTVGYGDLVPTAAVSKLFVSVYAIVSVALIAGMLQSLVERVADAQRLVVGRAQRAFLFAVESDDTLDDDDDDDDENDVHAHHTHAADSQRNVGSTAYRYGNVNARGGGKADQNADILRSNKAGNKPGSTNNATRRRQPASSLVSTRANAMRPTAGSTARAQHQHQEKRKHARKSRPRDDLVAKTTLAVRRAAKRLRATVAMVVLSGVFGVLLYAHFLNKSYIDMLYFLCMSMTTVGLGDIHPVTRVGKAYAAVWLILTSLGFANLLSQYANLRIKQRERDIAVQIMSGEIGERVFREIDLDGDGTLSEAEFLGYMLCKLGKASPDEVRSVLRRFHQLDGDGSGFITKNEVDATMKKKV